MDVGFDLGFGGFGQNSDLMATSSTPLGDLQDFVDNPIKTIQDAVPGTTNFGSGLFFPENFELSSYTAGFHGLSQDMLPVESPSHTFQDLVNDPLSPVLEHNVSMDSAVELDAHEDKPAPARRNTDGSVTMAQSRRKAQNRAAQRAFRERKERHVRDLEAQLSTLNEKATFLQSDNERLLDLLKRAHSENKALKAQSARQPQISPRSRPLVARSSSDEPTAPLMFVLKAFGQDNTMLPTPDLSTSSSTSSPLDSPYTRCLDPVATWDLLQGHPLFLKGVVDIGMVCDRLKTLARCEDSIGPVFDESDVRRVIEEVADNAHAEFT